MSFSEDVTAARAYDHWFDHGWGGYASGVEMRALLRAAGQLRGLRTLDVGCGTGRFTRELTSQGAVAIGIDNDPSMLEVARERGLAALVRGEASMLPFPAACVDIAFAVTVCEFLDDVAAVFAELARVTRPNGSCIVGSLNPRSAWGRFNRDRFAKPPWTTATFLSAERLKSLGAPYGRTSLSTALYAWEDVPALSKTGPLLEILGRLVPSWGAFQVLRVSKW